MFKFRSNSGQKCSPEPEPEQKCCSGTGTGTGIPVDLCASLLIQYSDKRMKSNKLRL